MNPAFAWLWAVETILGRGRIPGDDAAAAVALPPRRRNQRPAAQPGSVQLRLHEERARAGESASPLLRAEVCGRFGFRAAMHGRLAVRLPCPDTRINYLFTAMTCRTLDTGNNLRDKTQRNVHRARCAWNSESTKEQDETRPHSRNSVSELYRVMLVASVHGVSGQG